MPCAAATLRMTSLSALTCADMVCTSFASRTKSGFEKIEPLSRPSFTSTMATSDVRLLAGRPKSEPRKRMRSSRSTINAIRVTSGIVPNTTALPMACSRSAISVKRAVKSVSGVNCDASRWSNARTEPSASLLPIQHATRAGRSCSATCIWLPSHGNSTRPVSLAICETSVAVAASFSNDSVSAPLTARFNVLIVGSIRDRPRTLETLATGFVRMSEMGNGADILDAIRLGKLKGCVNRLASADCTPSPMLSPIPTNNAKLVCPVAFLAAGATKIMRARARADNAGRRHIFVTSLYFCAKTRETSK